MSRTLTCHVSRLLPPATTTPAPIQSIEYGAGGDCLFHSFAGILATMILQGGPPARHVLDKVPSAVFMAGQGAVMRRLRDLSANVFQLWTPEYVLNYALSATMQYKLYLAAAAGGNPRARDEFPDDWNPPQVWRQCGFGALEEADTIVAFQAEPSGDATVEVRRTQARPGGSRCDAVVTVPGGCAGLQQMRDELTAIHSRPGNCHWGTQTDVQSLSDALDLGILLFRNEPPAESRTCLYNICSQREDYPHWIALWWDEPTHFRAARVLGNVNWPRTQVPQILQDQYALANRLAN